MQSPVASSVAPSLVRSWRESVVAAVGQVTEALARGSFTRKYGISEIGYSVQGVLFRLIGRALAAARGQWPEDTTSRQFRQALTRSDDVLLESLAALDAVIRERAPWSAGRPWLAEETECPIEDWEPSAARALVGTLFSRGGDVLLPHGLSVGEVGRLYEALLVHHDSHRKSAAEAIFGRRKSTGAYYTPDAIVGHITQRTLSFLTPDWTPEEILALRVLDPAMGSGHFLLESLALLSEAVAEAEHREARGVRAQSLGSGVRDAIRRRWLVADSCLYGVDRDSRAVDMTRLLLWLAVGHSARLSPGLLHHISVGNSLVGCRVEDLGALPHGERMVALGRRVRAEIMRRRSEREDSPFPEDYRQVSASCDLRTSLWFEPPPTSADVKSLFDRARKLAKENQFLHWDLAFPEVFCDAEGKMRSDGGFDAILANPPYAARIRAFHSVLQKGRYTTTARDGGRLASLNTAAVFMDRAHQLLRTGGMMGFIVPNSILRVGQYEQIRKLLLHEYTVHEVVDEGAAFEAANLETVTIIAQRREASPEHRVLVRDRRGGRDAIDGHVEQHLFADRGVIALYLDDIALRMERAPGRLGEVVRNHRGAGISASDLMNLSRNSKTGRWMLRGRNLSRYAFVHLPGEDRYLRGEPAALNSNIASLFDEDKLLIQNIGSYIVAVLSTEGEGFLETVNVLPPLDGCGYPLSALLVLLNSRLMNYYFRRALINRSPLTVHLDGGYTDPLPLPDCSRPIAACALARHIASRLGAPEIADAPVSALLKGLGERLSDLGKRWSATLAHANDTLHEEFGWGTQQDVLDLVRRDLWTAPTERFLDELLARDATSPRWSEKKLCAVSEFHRRVAGEAEHIGAAMGRPPFPYERSLDALADELVYALYGLTEEQVARVRAESEA